MKTESQLHSHLTYDYTNPVRDPLWHHIYLSKGLEKLTRTHQFRRLMNIRQLGPAALVYPGATHTRYAHSLGVFYVAFQMVKTFLHHHPLPLLDTEGVKAFFTACLLHDLGHFPFTHSLKELPLKEHEALAAEMLYDSNIRDIIENHIETSVEMVAAIIDPELKTEDPRVLFFRNILSGPLDPDKLDYLNRDAYFCGVPYGIQDLDYTLTQIRPHEKLGILLPQEGIGAVEHLLFSKYQMYRYVYWHKYVRVPTAMIKKSLYMGLKDNLFSPEEMYHLDDSSFDTLATRGSKKLSNISKVLKGELYKSTAEYSYSDKNHQSLLPLEERLNAEEALRSRLNKKYKLSLTPEQVILDIPESFSLEFPEAMYGASGDLKTESIFSLNLLSKFKESIRKVRLILPDGTPCIQEDYSDFI